MPLSTESATNWQLTRLGLFSVTVLVAMIKASSLWCLRKRFPKPTWFYLLAPVGSAAGVAASPRATWAGAARLLLRSAAFGAALVALYWLYYRIGCARERSPLEASYLALPIVLLLGEVLGPPGQLLFFPTGYFAPAHHRSPWAAASLTEFWGRRWNTWFSDLFRGMLVEPRALRPSAALALTFLFSGLVHEVLIDGTLYWVTGRNLFGSQLLYFALQGIGVAVDRRYLRRAPGLRRVLTWVVVVVPAPLVVNEGLLRMLHLWPSR